MCYQLLNSWGIEVNVIHFVIKNHSDSKIPYTQLQSVLQQPSIMNKLVVFSFVVLLMVATLAPQPASAQSGGGHVLEKRQAKEVFAAACALKDLASKKGVHRDEVAKFINSKVPAKYRGKYSGLLNKSVGAVAKAAAVACKFSG